MGQHSMGPGGKGGFQAVKLQRPARTTVWSHSARAMAAVHSVYPIAIINDTQDERLYSCEHLKSGEGTALILSIRAAVSEPLDETG